MASKTLVVAALLLAVMAASASAQAPKLLGLGQLLINGTVHCSTGISTGTTAVFPNASVQLQCGNNVVSTAATNSVGAFSMSLGFITSLLSTLLDNCKLVVSTPLSTCDASLPTTGLLESALQLLSGGGLVGVILGLITNLIPSGFNLLSVTDEGGWYLLRVEI